MAASAWSKPDVLTLGGIPVLGIDSVEDVPITAIIYGWVGMGKTTLAASAAESEYGRPVHFLDIEGGMRSVAGMPYITRTPIGSWTEWQAVTQDLLALAPRSTPWQTLAVDNGSWLQDLNLQKHTQGGAVTPSYENGIWRKTADDMAAAIRVLRDIGQRHNLNIIINVWLDQREDKSGAQHQSLDFTPATAKLLPGLVDMVGYLEKGPDGVTRVLRLSSRDTKSPNRYRRSPHDERAARIPDTIWNPSFGSIIDVLRGGKEWPSEKHQPPTGQQQRVENNDKKDGSSGTKES